MNTESIKIESKTWDRGAYDRAIMVARDAHQRGAWDGEELIVIHDPYLTYAAQDHGDPLVIFRNDYNALAVRLPIRQYVPLLGWISY